MTTSKAKNDMKNLIIRTITGVLFVSIMVVGLLHPFAMVPLFALITGMLIWEYCGLVNALPEVNVNKFISTVAGVYFFIAVAGISSGGVQTFGVFIPYLLTIIYLLISELYTRNKNALNDWAYTMLAQMYIALPLSMVNVLGFRQAQDGSMSYYYLLPLCIFVFLWANDVGAYCTGSLIGRHKLFPRISPHKTWEGSIGGGVLVMILAAAVGYYENQTLNVYGFSIPVWLGLGLVVVMFGTWGDLVESLMKRTLGVKDSGSILPGHGGMLDRFDSTLMAVPAAVIYLYSLTLF